MAHFFIRLQMYPYRDEKAVIYMRGVPVRKLCLIFFLTLTTLSFAGSGKGILPYWGASGVSTDTNYSVYILNLTNISDNDVDVTVTFYKKDGTLLSSTHQSFYYFSANDTTIPAHGTAQINISHSGGWEQGYAIIQWENTNSSEDNSVALVALGTYVHRNTGIEARQSIMVNQGQPF